MKIPIITLWQPWASWVALGWKITETRTHNRFAKLDGETMAVKCLTHNAVDAGAKPIPGFEGYYATADGNVWSGKRGGELRKLKPHLSGGNGGVYRAVGLLVHGKHFGRKIAWCVLTAFVGPRPPRMYICHGPNGKRDDSLTNLSWGSRYKNNYEDKIRDGAMPWGEKHGQHRLTELQVRVARRARSFGVSYVDLGLCFDVCRSTIRAAVMRNTWGHVA